MPELPEVQTIISDLNKKIIGERITAVLSDNPKMFVSPVFTDFRKEVAGKEITDVSRRAKNIIIGLDSKKVIIIHLRMSGHLLVSNCWKFDGRKVFCSEERCSEEHMLDDKMNRFIHLSFNFESGKSLLLSDLRKFATIKLLEKAKISENFREFGPEPLTREFNWMIFKKRLGKKNIEVKKVLLDQNVVAGIGNIYADEILFASRIRPDRKLVALSDDDLKKIVSNIKKILKKAVKLRGTSVSDYRDTGGRKGSYQDVRMVYRREGEKCKTCGGKVFRKKIGQRSSYFCPSCQE